MRKLSYADLPETASASLIFESASRCLPDFVSACAALRGLPTSGRTESAARAKGAKDTQPKASARAAMPVRRSCRRIIVRCLLVEVLLGSDEADLGDAVALRGGHHSSHVLVGKQLVRAQVELGLRRLHRGAPKLRLERRAIRKRVTAS